MDLRNVGILQHYTTSQPRRPGLQNVISYFRRTNPSITVPFIQQALDKINYIENNEISEDKC